MFLDEFDFHFFNEPLKVSMNEETKNESIKYILQFVKSIGTRGVVGVTGSFDPDHGEIAVRKEFS